MICDMMEKYNQQHDWTNLWGQDDKRKDGGANYSKILLGALPCLQPPTPEWAQNLPPT